MDQFQSWERFVSRRSSLTITGDEKIIASQSGTTGYVTPETLSSFIAANPALMHLAGAETVTGPKIFEGGNFIDQGSQVFDVRAYGAVGDGVTDDGAAILLAVQAAAVVGGIIYFPPGDYYVSSPISLDSNLTIKGAGYTLSYFSTTMSQSNLRGIFTFTAKENITFDNVGFHVNGSSTAVTSYGHTNLNFIRCGFTGTTTTTGAGVVCLGGGGSGASGNMDDTYFYKCHFYDLTGLNARTIHIYPRNGHTVDNIQVIDCKFENVPLPIALDAYDILTNVKVVNNYFKNIIQGNGVSVPADCVWSRVTAGLITGLLVQGNTLENDDDTIVQGCLVSCYTVDDVKIIGNRAKGAYAGVDGVQGPFVAPGRTDYPQQGMIIAFNYIEGFDAAWDPDSMTDVQVFGNIVVNCGHGFAPGYGIKARINIHHNVEINCTTRAPLHSFFGSGAGVPEDCVVEDNLYIDDQGTPDALAGWYFHGSANDFGGITIRNNRMVIKNGAATNGDANFEFDRPRPVHFYNNWIKDSNGERLIWLVKAHGSTGGSIIFDEAKGSKHTITLTSNITSTTIPNGRAMGQVLRREFTMGGAGSYTYAKASNEKLVGGAFTPSATVGHLSILESEWDGTNWVETKRLVGLS